MVPSAFGGANRARGNGYETSAAACTWLTEEKMAKETFWRTRMNPRADQGSIGAMHFELTTAMPPYKVMPSWKQTART